MSTVSIWQDTSIWPALPHRREEADVCIIGAGLVGSTLAHFLGQAGKSVIVLEARDVARGASGRHARHVSAHGKAGYHFAVEKHGPAAVAEARALGLRTRAVVKRLPDAYGVWY